MSHPSSPHAIAVELALGLGCSHGHEAAQLGRILKAALCALARLLVFDCTWNGLWDIEFGPYFVIPIVLICAFQESVPSEFHYPQITAEPLTSTTSTIAAVTATLT